MNILKHDFVDEIVIRFDDLEIRILTVNDLKLGSHDRHPRSYINEDRFDKIEKP